MTAQSIMSEKLVTLKPHVTVAEALLEMSRHQVRNLPVVDEADAFLGLFGLRRLAHALLPTAVRLEEDERQMDIGFLSDQSDQFLRRLHEVGKLPVTALLEKKKKLRFCEPDTPIPKLLQLLSENPTSVPVVVVQGRHKRVVGMVSTWDVLTKIAINLLPEAPVDGERETSGRPSDAGEVP